jgi:hypothetical protein
VPAAGTLPGADRTEEVMPGHLSLPRKKRKRIPRTGSGSATGPGINFSIAFPDIFQNINVPEKGESFQSLLRVRVCLKR